MSRMRTLAAAAVIATLAVLIPAASAQAAPSDSLDTVQSQQNLWWGG